MSCIGACARAWVHALMRRVCTPECECALVRGDIISNSDVRYENAKSMQPLALILKDPRTCRLVASSFNTFTTGTVFIRQNLTSIDVRF